MEKKNVVESIARASILAQNVIDSEKNANDLVDLLDYLNSDESIPLLRVSVQSLCRVYTHLVRKNYTWIVPLGSKSITTSDHGRDVTTTSEGPGDVTQQYRQWMKQNYLTYLERLQELLHHRNEDMQWLSLCSLMSLVECEGVAHQSNTKAYIFPNTFFHTIVTHLLDDSDNRSNLIGRFTDEYLKYDDVRYYWLKNISSIISSKVDKKVQNLKVSQHFVKNCQFALDPVIMPSTEHSIGEFLTGSPPEITTPAEHMEAENDDSEEDIREEEVDKPPKVKRTKREMKALNIRSLQKHRKQFSDAWLAFLRLPLTPTQCKHVLVFIHSGVIPHLLDPRLLLDFFTFSYDEGGVIGLLALNGLFVLMNQHHLDYPDFYNKLYLLLEPSVFHVKYMQRFFHLLDTFLKSSHLSLYLVAAFAKKIARLSLSAPPNGVMVAAVFVTNLIKRHPNCKVLLHRQATDDRDNITANTDPFDLNEPDPAKCAALQSSLWELKTLQSHYCPAVSRLVKHVLDPGTSNSKVEVELGKYLDIDSEQLFREAFADLRHTDAVPMNFQEPTGLWQTQQLEVNV